MKKPIPPRLRKFPASKQHRLDELLDKNSEGAITPVEATTLAQLVAEAEELMVAKAKRIEEFSKAESVGLPVGAVPVTVWVQAGHGER